MTAGVGPVRSTAVKGWVLLISSRIGCAAAGESTRQPEEERRWKVVDDCERIDVSNEVFPQARKKTVTKGSPEKEDLDDGNAANTECDKDRFHMAITARTRYGNLTSLACGTRQ